MEKNADPIKKSLKILIEISESSNIPFICFKSILMGGSGLDDVDVLVPDKKSYDLYRDHLRLTGYVLSRDEKGGASHWDKQDHAQIDLHYILSWGHFGNSGEGPSIVDQEKIMTRAQNYNYKGLSIQVPTIEDEVVIVLAHSVFQHSYLLKEDGLFIDKLIDNSEVDLDLVRNTINKFGWDKVADYLLRNNNWEVGQRVVYIPLHILAPLFFKIERGNIANRVYFTFVRVSCYLYRYLFYTLTGRLAFN